MAHMDVVDMAMPSSGRWTAADLGLVLVMWVVMMAGMMLPSALPVVLLYRRVVGAREAAAAPAVLTGLFLAGYLFAWSLYAVEATLVQWALHEAARTAFGMSPGTSLAGGVVLLAAGAYQLSPYKRACLGLCRSPLAFLLNAWRPGPRGALAMGLQHGLYCIGCCWLLMAVLFVVGVMSLPWVAGLTLLVLAEKVVPRGERLARAAGLALIAWGAWLVLR